MVKTNNSCGNITVPGFLLLRAQSTANEDDDRVSGFSSCEVGPISTKRRCPPPPARMVGCASSLPGRVHFHCGLNPCRRGSTGLAAPNCLGASLAAMSPASADPRPAFWGAIGRTTRALGQGALCRQRLASIDRICRARNAPARWRKARWLRHCLRPGYNRHTHVPDMNRARRRQWLNPYPTGTTR
jgi:hypothetical protein